MKTIHFVSGLPRSGSTLLTNLLCQNPNFHATSTSGILNILLLIRNQWNNFEEFRASPNEDGKVRVLRSVLDAYHNQDKVIFDKSRGWCGHIEMAETINQRKCKILCPVRDVRDVLASLEKLWRNASKTRQITQEAAFPLKFKTLEGRLEVWADASGMVGSAFNGIKDAMDRGLRDRLHFVKYDDLTKYPSKTMKAVYEFLEEPWYDHDWNNVVQVTSEDDEVYGFGPGLHTIRPKIEPQKPQWPEILGKAADKYAGAELW
jgi:sulfotransferase